MSTVVTARALADLVRDLLIVALAALGTGCSACALRLARGLRCRPRPAAPVPDDMRYQIRSRLTDARYRN